MSVSLDECCVVFDRGFVSLHVGVSKVQMMSVFVASSIIGRGE